MAKQSFSVGQVLTANQMLSLQQTAMLGGSATAKTASYTLVAADAGTVVSVNSTSATTITVNTGLFSAGDTVTIQNWGSGLVTITAGTATVNTAGSLIVPQYDGGVLYFTSASEAIYFDFVQAGAVSPLTTKGDLYTFGSSDTRIGVGANDTVLIADSSTATGLKWGTPASGGITLITETVASAVTSITYGSIPSTYKDLLLVFDGLTTSTNDTQFVIRLNNDSGTTYYGKVFKFTQSGSITSGSGQSLGANEPNNLAMAYTDPSDLADRWAGTLRIYNYASASKLKRYDYQTGGLLSFLSERRGGMCIGTFNSTSAISSIDVVRSSGTGTLSNATNTSIRLYGIS